MRAFDIAWALLKSDDFYEAFEGQNPNNPTMQEALRMQQEREYRDAFRPREPRKIPESEYNPYDPGIVWVRRRLRGQVGPSAIKKIPVSYGDVEEYDIPIIDRIDFKNENW